MESNDQSSPKLVWQFAAIFLLALLVRLICVFYVSGYSSGIGHDNYETAALNFLDGKGIMYLEGHPSAYRAPLYPLTIAGLYSVFGTHPFVVWIAQCILGALTAGLVFLLARGFVSPTLARVSGIVASLYPPFILLCGMLLSETLFTFLFMMALYLMGPRWWDVSVPKAVGIGFFMGLAALTRPVLFLLPIALVLLSLFNRIRRRKAMLPKAQAVLLISFFLTMSPWVIRNRVVMGTPIWTTTEPGASLWVGVHPGPRGFGYNNAERMYPLLEEAGLTDEMEMNRFLMKEARKDILADPARYARLSLFKVGWMFNVFDGVDYRLGTPYNFPVAIVLSLGFLGILLRGRKDEALFLASILGYFVLIAAIIHGIPRYRVPLDPLFIVFGAMGLNAVVSMPRARKRIWSLALGGWILLNAGMVFAGDAAKDSIKGMLDKTMQYSTTVRGDT